MERQWGELFFPVEVDSIEEENIEKVREILSKVAEFMEENLKDGRYKSLVRTHLELVGMYATKSFTHE
jgi:hypothetical protein